MMRAKMKMKRFWMRALPALLATSLALPARAGEDWRPIDVSKGRPSAGSLTKAYLSPSVDGEYQLRMVGEKFAAVFTADGVPLAVFDLTLHSLSWQERILGAIGFGDLSLWRLVKAIQRKKKSEREANDAGAGELAATEDEADPAAIRRLLKLAGDEAGDDRAEKPLTEKQRRRLLKRGREFFKDLRFNARWAERNGVVLAAGQQSVPFRLSTFTLADLWFGREKDREAFREPFLKLAQLLYPAESWTEASVADFMEELEFRFDPAKPGYDLVWNLEGRKSKKRPKLPGIVLNFLDPYANLIYKHQLRQFDQYGEPLIRQLGLPGVILDVILSRVVHGLSERLDYHERQLLALLEATQRFEYSPDLPMELIDVMTDLVYLSHYDGAGDPNLTDGVAKRKILRTEQEAARPKTLSRLSQLKQAKDVSFQEMVDGKFALAWKAGAGEEPEFRGIYGLGLAPTRFLRRPALHVHPRSALPKMAERYASEFAGSLVRTMLPGFFGLRIGSVSIAIQIPPALYQHWFRARTISEVRLEGELVGLVDEALRQRLALPLNMDQLSYVQKHLRATCANPYELLLDEEPAVREKNLRILKDVLAGETSLLRDPKAMVPYSI